MLQPAEKVPNDRPAQTPGRTGLASVGWRFAGIGFFAGVAFLLLATLFGANTPLAAPPAHHVAAKGSQPASPQIGVLQGRIDKWNSDRQLQAGGVLGLGDKSLDIEGDTLVLNTDGKRLDRSALEPGRQIASVYAIAKVSGNGSNNSNKRKAIVIVVKK